MTTGRASEDSAQRSPGDASLRVFELPESWGDTISHATGVQLDRNVDLILTSNFSLSINMHGNAATLKSRQTTRMSSMVIVDNPGFAEDSPRTSRAMGAQLSFALAPSAVSQSTSAERSCGCSTRPNLDDGAQPGRPRAVWSAARLVQGQAVAAKQLGGT